ncbi:MAG: hypothetical protein CVU11_02015 [Bacteroidetes bacterium HGW-Bacteroidetes-6]|jgi:aspartate/methionine/tyrosine aminotransferase|nr:MAG: hypothetical protein CVU11_02015 [Bacteroidetes bacterium HGW-Bacteroidetes-6]
MSIPQGSLISYFSTLVKQNGGINLAQGIPGFDPPEELIAALKEVAGDPIHQYPPGTGNFKLVSQLSLHLQPQKELSSDEILILQGATEALSLVFLYILKTNGGPFNTIAFSPPYESYRQLPLQFGLPFTELQANEAGQIPLEAVAKSIDEDNTKLVFLASPGNPHGKIFEPNDINKLIDVCSEKHCYLLFDAAYRSLYFGKEPYVPFKKLNPYLFIADSFSKLWSVTGWRVGYLIHDASHAAAIRSLHDYTGLCANSVAQEALARYAAKNQFGASYSKMLRSELRKNFTTAISALTAAGFKPAQADGGYFVWSELPTEFNDGFEFAKSLYNTTKVAVVPGIHFSPMAKTFIRINIARPTSELQEGLKRIQQFVAKQ